MTKSLSLIFVVDGKGLEAMSLLLVASLHHHHCTDPDVEIVAYVTPNTRDMLDPQTLALYQRCNVQIAPLDNSDIAWKRDYPHGNKIIACAAMRDSLATIFLDTDMVCMAPLTSSELDIENRVCVVPEGVPTWGKGNDRWQRAYAHYGLPYPTDRVTLTRRRRIKYVPYFNAGFIAFPNRAIHEGKAFGQLWLETALDFDWKCPVAQKRPWLDQITIPLTLKRFGMDYQVLPDLYNFSLSDRTEFDSAQNAKILHYHRAKYLEPAPQFKMVCQWLQAALPDVDDDVTDLLAKAGFGAAEVS